MNWLVFVLRWFHLVAAITAVGGTIFMRLALVPSIGVLADEQRKALHEQIRSRWSKLIMASIGFLLITGLINYVLFLLTSKTSPWDQWRQSCNAIYQAAFGVKFLLALAIFFIASALTGRTEATKKIRENAKWWMTLNLLLALVVVALSGFMRATHVGPNLPESAASITSGGGNG